MALRLVLIAALLRPLAAAPAADTARVDRCVVDGALDVAEAGMAQSTHLGLLQFHVSPRAPAGNTTPASAQVAGPVQATPLEPAGGVKPAGATVVGATQANPLELAETKTPAVAPGAGAAQANPLEPTEGSKPAGAAGKGPASNTSLVAKQLPDIIGNIAGGILGDVAEGLVGGLASAVASALDPLERILGEAADETSRSVGVLLDRLRGADINATELVLTFQREVGAVLSSATERWETISGAATTAVNACTLALNGLGQEELASQISSVLGNIVAFIDNLLSVLRHANSMVAALHDRLDDELVRQLFRVNETLSSVLEQVDQFEATISSSITSFVGQAESALGMTNSTALDPIEQELNGIVSQISTAVQTIVLGVSDAVVLVMNAVGNDSGLNVTDIVSRMRSGAASPSWSFTVAAVAAVLVALS